jgi:hypothetical protein
MGSRRSSHRTRNQHPQAEQPIAGADIGIFVSTALYALRDPASAPRKNAFGFDGIKTSAPVF